MVYTYFWKISMVNVGKYTIHGCCGKGTEPGKWQPPWGARMRRSPDAAHGLQCEESLANPRIRAAHSSSTMARCMGYNNTFILSVMLFTISYFGLTTTGSEHDQTSSRNYPNVGGRNYANVEAATVAAIGLYLWEGNAVEDLALDNPNRVGCNLRRQSDS